MGASPRKRLRSWRRCSRPRRPGDGRLRPARSRTSAPSRTRARTCRAARASSCARSTGRSRVPANGEIHNVPLSVPAPCTNCRITDMVPNLVFDGSGATANMDNGMLLHHFVFFNPAQTGIGCPISEPFFGAGNERTHRICPRRSATRTTAANWNMITHLVNKSATARTVNVEIIFRWRPLSETGDTRPAVARHRLDLQRRRLRVHDPDGLLRHARELDRAADGRIIDMYGHLHDIDIIDPSFVPGALPGARRRDRAVGRAGGRHRQHLLRADPAQQPAAGRHHGRDACADRRPTTGPRSAPATAPTATSIPMATAGSSATCPRAGRRRRIPTGGDYPSDGLPINDRTGDQAPQRVPERLGQSPRPT